MENINITQGEQKDKNKKSGISKGDNLEYRMKRLLFYMGYYAQNNVVLKTSSEHDAETITDIDVYGIYIHKDFRKKTVCVDCKSGGAKPLERILWLKGLKDLYNIDDILFVKSNVKKSIKEFARKNDIQVLEIQTIERLEKSYLSDTSLWKGSCNYSIDAGKLNELAQFNIPTSDDYKKVKEFISHGFWGLDNYGRLKKTITALKILASVPLDSLKENDNTLIRWATYKLVVFLALSVIDICRELYYYSDVEIKEIIKNKLVSGDIPINKRREILSGSYKLAYQILKTENPNITLQQNTMDLAYFEQPPAYYDALIDLVFRIMNSPTKYYEVVRFMDYSLFEYDLNNRPYDNNELLQIFDDIEGKTTAAKMVMHFICQEVKVNKGIFEMLK